jgi:pimeloyl-ACP methyl ester carboxylesterase
MTGPSSEQPHARQEPWPEPHVRADLPAISDRLDLLRLAVFPRSGHLTFVDQPILFRKVIDDFVHRRR